MVLAKRNANGEFVVWNSSSQGSTSQPQELEHEKNEAPAPKRARISSPKSSPSRHIASAVPAVKQNVASASKNVMENTSVRVPLPATSTSFAPGSQSLSAFPVQGRAQASVSTSPISLSQSSPVSLPPYRTASASFEVGSSQMSASASPAKQGRKTATGSPEKPEKRQAIFKKKCPQNILERVERVMTQRIFMIDRNRLGDLKEEFSVLGSTGNVYKVVIDHKPHCSCPDAMKGNHCKHILFIMLKVLQVSQGSGHWYQKALLTTELEEIFAGAPLAPNSLAHPHIRDAYARATGKAPTNPAPTPSNDNRRVPGPDDDCPVCYDGMHGVAEASLVFCEDCGNALHKECFVQWQRTAANAGKDLTCVWCRARWVLGPTSGGGGVGPNIGEDGYLNLAGVGGISPVRDTSTYYHGPRRGNRYYRRY